MKYEADEARLQRDFCLEIGNGTLRDDEALLRPGVAPECRNAPNQGDLDGPALDQPAFDPNGQCLILRNQGKASSSAGQELAGDIAGTRMGADRFSLPSRKRRGAVASLPKHSMSQPSGRNGVDQIANGAPACAEYR